MEVYNERNSQFPGDWTDIGTVHAIFGKYAADILLTEERVQEVTDGFWMLQVPRDETVVQECRQQSQQFSADGTGGKGIPNRSPATDVLREIVVQDNLLSLQPLNV